MDGLIKHTLKVSLIACVILGTTEGKDIIVKQGETQNVTLKVDTDTDPLNVQNRGTLTLSGSKNKGDTKIDNFNTLNTNSGLTLGSKATIYNHQGATISGKFEMQNSFTIENSGTIENLLSIPPSGGGGSGTKNDIKISNLGKDSLIKSLTLADDDAQVINDGGTIKSLTQSSNDAIAQTGSKLDLKNSGIIEDLKLQGEENKINNEKNGRIDKITFSNGLDADVKPVKPTKNTLANSGIISHLVFKGTNSEVTLASGYRVELGSVVDYEKKGALGITMEKPTDKDGKPIQPQAGEPSAKLTLSNLTVTLGEGVTLDRGYDLKHFILGTDSKGSTQGTLKVNNQDSTQITATLKDHLTLVLPSNLFTAHFNTTSLIVSTNNQNEISPIGVYQGIETLTSIQTQINHHLNSLHSNTLLSSLFKQDSQVSYQSLIAFALPYYSYSSITPFDVDSQTHRIGMLGGVSKKLDNGLIVGGHLGLEYQNTQGRINSSTIDTEEKLKINGASLALGGHLHYTFTSFKLPSLLLTPYLQAQFNTLLFFNTHTLQINESRSQKTTIYGLDLSILSGAKFATQFGDFALEAGFNQQWLKRPELSFVGFSASLNDRKIQTISIYPFSMLLQAGYSKEIKLHSFSLIPSIKAGMRIALFGKEFENRFWLAQKSLSANHHLDTVKGTLQVGLGSQIKENLFINATYDGSFSTKTKTHTLNAQIQYVF